MSREIRAIRGGSFVAINNVMGTGVTLVAAFLLSKALGPKEFAIYSFCTSLTGVLRCLSRLGVNASLLTQKEEPQPEIYGTALTTMLVSSIVVAIPAAILIPFLGRFSHIPHLFWPGIATIILVPFHIISLPALTRLERQLKYKPVAIIEFTGQVVGQILAIALAFHGWGIWGPITGWSLRALFQSITPWIAAGLKPRLRWDPTVSRRMIKYGSGYVLATSLAQGRTLFLLAIVGRLFGQEAIGYMGLTLRAASLAAPFRAAISRVILPAIAPIAHLPAKLKEKINATVEMEILLSAPVTVIAVATYPYFVRLILGNSWLPTVELFPWIAAGSLLMSVHSAALSALYVRGYFAESICSTIISYMALLLALVLFGNLLGLQGGAIATLVVWPASWVIEVFAHRRLGISWSRNGVVWALAGTFACLTDIIGLWMLIPVSLIFAATYASIKARSVAMYNALFSRL